MLLVQYRDYGKTGKKISALSYGAMRLPKDEDEAVACIVRSFELGVNYVDTAYGYNDGWSEQMVGRAAKQWGRETIYLTTKNPMENDTYDGWCTLHILGFLLAMASNCCGREKIPVSS